MSTRNLAARLARLPKLTADRELCIHHGGLCALGTRPLPDLYLMITEATRRAGEIVPPLNEHRAMTPGELAEYDRETAALVAEAEAENELQHAAILAGRDA